VRARELGAAGALAEAIDHAHRAVPWIRAEALCELADLYRRARRYDEALRFAKQAQDASFGLAESARALRVLGLIAADSTPEGAEPLLRHAADAYRHAGEDLEVAETMRLLGRFLAGQEQLHEAVSCLDQACATVLAPRSPRS
jgi:tetratricopeptide (TPR) repeat protein